MLTDKNTAQRDNATHMKTFIREHFGQLLGQHEQLLDEPGGLDLLAEMVRNGKFGALPR